MAGMSRRSTRSQADASVSYRLGDASVSYRLGIERWAALESVSAWARRQAFVWDTCVAQVGLPGGFLLGLVLVAREPATAVLSYWRGAVALMGGIATGLVIAYAVGSVLWSLGRR
jgi:hypothetical protein